MAYKDENVPFGEICKKCKEMARKRRSSGKSSADTVSEQHSSVNKEETKSALTLSEDVENKAEATEETKKQIDILEREKEQLNLRNPQHIRRHQVLCDEIRKLNQKKQEKEFTFSADRGRRKHHRAPSTSPGAKLDKTKDQPTDELITGEEYSLSDPEADPQVTLKKRNEIMDKILEELKKMKEKIGVIGGELKQNLEKKDQQFDQLRRRTLEKKKKHQDDVCSMRRRMDLLHSNDKKVLSILGNLLKVSDSAPNAETDNDIDNLWFNLLDYGIHLLKRGLYTIATIRDGLFPPVEDKTPQSVSMKTAVDEISPRKENNNLTD